MEIELKTNNVTKKIDQGITELDFGNLKFKSKAVINFKVLGNISNLSVESTCGCSTAIVGADNSAEIEYKNTNIKNPFAKIIKVSYKENGVQKNEKIRIKGNIID